MQRLLPTIRAYQTSSHAKTAKPVLEELLATVLHQIWPEFETFTAMFLALCLGERFTKLSQLLAACGASLLEADDVALLPPQQVAVLADKLPDSPQELTVKKVIRSLDNEQSPVIDLQLGGVFLFQSNEAQAGFDVLVYQPNGFLLAIECKYPKEAASTVLTAGQVARKQSLAAAQLLPWLSGTVVSVSLVSDYSLLTVGCWLLVVGCWLLVVGCWLLIVGCCVFKCSNISERTGSLVLW